MADPTRKSVAVNGLINVLIGDSREGAISEDRCIQPPIGCGGVVTGFRDKTSRIEYNISGLCQKCQDELFAT